MSTIDDVKARLDIVDTVSGYVPNLKKSGRSYKALCPFHNERTPSFTVDPERGSWHCFGACSTGGDVIEFVRRIEQLEFPEALRLCAQRAGVELRPPSRREQQQREVHERLLRANEAAAMFFQAAFEGPAGAEALRYLEQRGLDQETRNTWQLGYAPEGWRGLLEHLRARGFTDGDLVEAGLAVEGDSSSGGSSDGGGAYDRFRHRLMFPIRDAGGRLIGFGARALPREGQPEDDPKYLNTPQTPLFDKSGTLYGLDRAGEAARRAGRVVVVEGYMDVIAAHQFGIENVVASMGTAITEKQMNLAKRFTPNVVLALDADAAGSEATLRGVAVAAGTADRETIPTVDWSGLVRYQDVLQADIGVVTMPEGEDPDTLIRADPARFRALLEESKPVTDHLFEAITAATDLDDPRARSQALEALAPTVSAIVDPVVRAHYVQRLARIGQVDERVVLALLGRRGRRGTPQPLPSAAEVRRRVQQSVPSLDGETQLLQLLLHRPESREAGLEVDPDTFEETTNRRLFSAWRELGDLAERMDDLDDDVRERFESIRASVPESLDRNLLEDRYVAKMVEDISAELRGRRARERFRPAAAEQVDRVVAARRDGAGVLESASRAIKDGPPPDEAADETAELAAEFAEMSARQPALTRERQMRTARRPSPGKGGDREEAAGDADV